MPNARLVAGVCSGVQLRSVSPDAVMLARNSQSAKNSAKPDSTFGSMGCHLPKSVMSALLTDMLLY